MVLELTERQRVAHLLRRFGFGASLSELEEYVPLGVEGALARLVDFGEPADDLGHPVQLSWRKDEEAEVGGYLYRHWWALQMLVTRTPLREKLALFWHDHFAVLEEDVQHGVAMLDYMLELRRNPNGKFGEILNRFARSVALMRQLNVEMVSRARPNENFARELLELYTLGEGHYTEEDIQELSRCLTGWSHMDVFYRLGSRHDERLRHMMEHETPGVFFIWAPAVNIPGKKRVLGREFTTADEVVDFLAHHPQTARYLCTKLWEFFAYARPEEEVVERMAKVFMEKDGHIGEVLKAMARQPEFWSAKCVRGLVKNPVDYVMGIARAQNVRERVMDDAKEMGTWATPMPEGLRSAGGGAMYWIDQCGWPIFFPKTVAGWDWGESWLSTNTLLRRRDFTGLLTYYPVGEGEKQEWHPDKPILFVVNEVKMRNPQTTEAMVQAFCLVYDCPLGAEQQSVMVKHFDKHGGVQMLTNDRWAAWPMTLALQLLGSAPEFHMC